MKRIFPIILALGLQGPGAIVATNLWQGSVDTGNWAKSVDVEAAKFADASEGSSITISFTVNESYGKLELNTSEFDLLDAQSTLTGLNGMNEFDKTATSTSATLSARDVTRLKHSGLKIIGEYLTITSVDLSDKPDDPEIPDVEPEYPIHLYIADSADGKPIAELTRVGTSYYGDDVKIACGGFVLTTVAAPTWEEINRRRHFGAETLWQQLDDHTPSPIVDYNGDETAANPWTLAEGFYSFDADLAQFTLTAIRIPSGISTIDADSRPAEYFTIYGTKIATPSTPGIYIRRVGLQTTTVLIR